MIDVELHGGPHDGRQHNAVALDAILTVPTVIRRDDDEVPEVVMTPYRWLGRHAASGLPLFEYENAPHSG